MRKYILNIEQIDSAEEQEENEDSLYIEEYITNDEITREEITEAMKKSKGGKAAKHDGITTARLQNKTTTTRTE